MKIGRLLALIGTILSIIGTFLFTLYSYINPVYGVGGIISLASAFSLATSWIDFVLIIVFIIFILACIVQLIGIPNSISAIIGGGITLIFCVFIFLGVFGLIPGFTNGIGFLLDHTEWIPGVIPVTVELLGVGLGTYIATVGGIISLVSGFFPRE
ncbi:MAG: hypothetical protein JW776_04915 [Candidatus Lokiarchaeota archaeon]|nr:hypothetical protein [Candidatus Lokiarchaeota archaeon]